MLGRIYLRGRLLFSSFMFLVLVTPSGFLRFASIRFDFLLCRGHLSFLINLRIWKTKDKVINSQDQTSIELILYEGISQEPLRIAIVD